MDGLYYREEGKMKDALSGDSNTKRTATVVRDMMNSLSEFLNLTLQITDDSEDLKYTGETSRAAWETIGEHVKYAKNLERVTLPSIGSWNILRKMFSHLLSFRLYHNTRQLKEAVRIRNSPGTLNSKGEIGACRIPRMVIEQGEYERKNKEIIEK